MQQLHIKIKDILEKENVKIIPKWHFVLKSLLIICSVIFIFFSSIFLFSFFIFKNRMLPPHAMSDIILNMQLLPWLLSSLLLFIAGIIFLLSSKYNFVYKKPALVIIIVLLFIIILFSIVIDRLTLHDRFRENFRRGRVPVMREMYDFDDMREKKEFINRINSLER